MKLEDIAKLAGVSRSTVSRVVNNDPNVSPATREKVLQVIQEQDFRPNLVARALVTRQTQTLSLVIPQRVGEVFADPYFPTLIQGIMAEATRRDYAVMLWMGNSFEEEKSFCQRVLNNGFFDGVLVSTVVDDDPLIPRLAEANFPFVLIGPPPNDDVHYVDVDNLGGAFAAVTHLLELGRRRIGIITGPLNMAASRDRLAGYRQALETAHVPYDEMLVVTGNYDYQSGLLAGEQLVLHDIDAIFATNDSMAIGAIQAINRAGKTVPDDISVVGFDDLSIAQETVPNLTTVRQDIDLLGGSATALLIDLVTDADPKPCNTVLPTQLIVRDSCGAMR